MTPGQAAKAVASARHQAEAAAARDLNRLRDQALQKGQARAEELFPLNRRTSPQLTGSPRSSRILRNWYAEVYTAALRHRLGEQTKVPAAAQVDATATVLRRTLGSRDPNMALRMVGALHRRARVDAADTGASLHTTLTETAQRRATEHIAGQPPTDEARTAILEQWYQRCYRATVDGQLGLLQPLQAVTVAETREVAGSVEAGQPRRIIGADGIPLVTAHGTAMTDVDRRLAAGETQVVEPPRLQVGNQLLRTRVTQAWDSQAGAGDGNEHRGTRRKEWAEASGVPAAAVSRPWKELSGEHQSRLIASWLDTHQDQPPRLARAWPPIDRPFRAEPLSGPPRAAAAAMFNQQQLPVAAVEVRGVTAAMFPANSSRPPAREVGRPDAAPTRSRQLTLGSAGRDIER